MSQGTAKKLVGQQASADSDPVVLSAEQEVYLSNMDSYLSNIDGATTGTANLLSNVILPESAAVAGLSGMMLLGEDDSGDSEFLRSSAGSLYVRFASQPMVTIDDGGGSIAINDGSGSITVDDGGSTLSIDDNGGSITVDGSVTLGAGTAYAGKVRLTDGTTDAEVVPLAGYNGQAVAIVDGNGDQITSFGGGTQYTEDAAAAANPVGTAPILIRQDTPAAVTSADGDNVAQRGSNYGGAYTHILDPDGNISNLEAKLDQVLRQLRSRPELNAVGNVKVELQATGTSPVTITSGAVTVASVGAAAADQSFVPMMFYNLLFRSQLSQILT